MKKKTALMWFVVICNCEFVLSGSSCILAGSRRSVSFCSSSRDETLENSACVTESEGRILADPSSSIACRISLFR